MTTIDMNFVADALLDLCDPMARGRAKRERPFGSFQTATDPGEIYHAVLSAQGGPPLLEDECREVLARASLTPKQLKVLEMRLDGVTFEEIGRRRGHSKQAALNIFVQAIKKIARARYVYPYTGLSDVYRIETSRGA